MHSCQSALYGHAYPAGRSFVHWAALKGRARTSRWRTGDFYFAQRSDLLGNVQVCTEDHSRGDASQNRPLGARRGQPGDSQRALRCSDVIKKHRKCGGGRGATCGARSRLMLRKFPSWERRSRFASKSRAARRKASLPCDREPSVKTLGKGLRGIRARRWRLSPAVHAIRGCRLHTGGFWSFLWESLGSCCCVLREQRPPEGLHMLG